MKKLAIGVFIFILFPHNSFTQELKGLKMFLCFIHYSESSESFKNILPTHKDIIETITYKIPEFVSAIGKPIVSEEFCSLVISYNYFQNYEITDEKIYYGAIGLKVFRDFDENRFNTKITVKVFQEEYYICMVNPSSDMIKSDAFQITNELIDKLALEYYKDN